MKNTFFRKARAGYSLTEVLVTMGIATATLGATMGIFLSGLKTMTKDTARLETNRKLRYSMAQIAKNTTSATGFYLFPSYKKLDGSVDLSTDLAADADADPSNGFLAYGDCVVIEYRTSTQASDARIRQLHIYYRVPTSNAPNASGPLRYYQSSDLGLSGPAATAANLTALLNNINLDTNPTLAGSRELVGSTLGNPIYNVIPAANYPVFSTPDSVAPANGNQNLSINVQLINSGVINGSSLNYTISPRGAK